VVGGLSAFRHRAHLGTFPRVKWRWAVARRERADVVIDLRERLAPYVVPSADDPPEVSELTPVGAPAPYKPRHLAT
jgi:hypothetical protein